MNQTPSRLYRFVQFLHSTLVLLTVLTMIVQISVFAIFLIIAVDCDNDLYAWHNFLHSATRLIGDAEVDDFTEFRTAPASDGSYDVYYVGTIYPDACERLVNLCQQADLSQVVIQRITLPNGVRKWFTISLDTLRSSYNSSLDYHPPVLISEVVHIQAGPEAWLRAQCIRPCQDWMTRTGCTPFESCLLCVASVFVIGALFILIFSLLDRPLTSYTRRVLAAQRSSEPTMVIDIRGATFTLVESSSEPPAKSTPAATPEPPTE